MKDLRSRGYGWGDIALLAQKNADVVRATSWLNDMGVPFISFSSLDVRTRDGGRRDARAAVLPGFAAGRPCLRHVRPGKDLSRAPCGHVEGWGRMPPRRCGTFSSTNRPQRPLYKAFQRAFPDLWKACFAGLFRSAGYLPLYDLVSEACVRFDVFSLVGEEEATLAKLLEVVKEFEGTGANSLREFLGAADEAGRGRQRGEVGHRRAAQRAIGERHDHPQGKGPGIPRRGGPPLRRVRSPLRVLGPEGGR